jgi:RNA polymerase sigma-70 factor (ECF subfamily)
MDALEEQVTRAFEDERDDIYRYLLTLGLVPAHAQDAAQEVFLRLYLALRKGEAIQNVRAWIFRVAHNLALDWRAKERMQPVDPDVLDRIRDMRPGAEADLLEKEKMERIAAVWKTLSPQQRECLHLRAEGLKYREISETLRIGISTVREFLNRAITKLQRAAYE